ncbi:MAG TPA: MFS transporter [Sediminispirochaeta sp.]|nr:MFS transporter [Sediminispirochaeta sp.]
MNKNEKIILSLVSAAHFFTHFSMLAFPAMVMPLSRDLGLPISEVVGLSFWMYFFYGVLAMGWGWMSDKWGHKPAMGTGMLIAGIGLILAGINPSLSLLPASFALVGIGCSSFHPAGTALASQGIRERGRAMGISGIWGSVGMALVPFLVGLSNFLIGWRGGMVVLGAVGIILGVGSFLAPFTVEKDSDQTTTQVLANSTATKLFALFALAMVFGGILFRSFTLILPAFMEFRLGNISAMLRTWISEHLFLLEDASAFNTLSANVVTTFVYIMAIVGQHIGGKIADRYDLTKAYFFYFFSGIPFLIGATLLESWLLIPATGLFALFLLGMQPIENSLVAFLTPARWRSVGYGLKFTIVFGAGSFGVKIVSFVEESYGMAAVMWFNFVTLLGVVLFAGILVYAARNLDIRHHAEETVQASGS